MPMPCARGRAGKVKLTALSVTAGLALGVFVVAAHAAPAGATICKPGAHVTVHDSPGHAYLIRNVSKLSSPSACIELTGGSGFKVTRTPDPEGGHVTAFPDIARGCIWYACSPNSPFPVRVGHIKWLRSTWHTLSPDHGFWNTAYDLWLGRHKQDPDGRSTRDGAELMVWINYHGFSGGNWHSVTSIDGHRWFFTHWIHCDDAIGVCWKLIIFRIVHPRPGVTDLHLRKFLAYAKHHGLVKDRWWLESVDAGFEIWSHGEGLGTNRFAVTMRRR